MIKQDVVITGIGVLSPIGIDTESYWTALLENRSGIAPVRSLDPFGTPRPLAGEVPDFKAKDYVKPKKNIKVMSRDIQLGFVAAVHACTDAGLITEGESRSVDPDRFGVVLGADLIGLELPELFDAFRAGIQNGTYEFSRWGGSAMEHIFPLWMLKYLPNMPACHIAIAHDARGPNNSLTMQRGSSLAAIFEAARIIERGGADVMICGGCGNGVNPSFFARNKLHHLGKSGENPQAIPRPFDRDRSWAVLGEGAGVFILERRDFAVARGAKMYAKIRGFCNTIAPTPHNGPLSTLGIRGAIRGALENAGIRPDDLGHLNADGNGTVLEDRIEAEAIRAELGDVPVTALKGYFGNLGSGAGAVETAASVLALQKGVIPPTKNCDTTAEDCPIQVVREKPLQSTQSFALKINQTLDGRSFALVLEKA